MSQNIEIASVGAVQRHQKSWLAATRNLVLAGKHFAICNADEFEEVFTALDIPCLVINQWNMTIAAAGEGVHFDNVLAEHGFTPNKFARGLATALEPERAPWGGLPKPCVIVAPTRDDAQFRITELWAEAAGCVCYPLDFGWGAAFSGDLPERWWEIRRSGGTFPIDLVRANHRLEQMKRLLAHLEFATGKKFRPLRLVEVLDLVNQQAKAWQAAFDIIANAPRLPISLADQIALYDVNWQRGRKANLDLVEALIKEADVAVRNGRRCHGRESFRLYLATTGGDPAYHQYLREAHGGVIVSNRFSAIGAMYRQEIDASEPLRSLAHRQLFMFDKNPHWEIYEARRWRADAMISIEPDRPWLSHYAKVSEAAGLPYLGLPADADTSDIRERIDAFVRTRLARSERIQTE